MTQRFEVANKESSEQNIKADMMIESVQSLRQSFSSVRELSERQITQIMLYNNDLEKISAVVWPVLSSKTSSAKSSIALKH